MTSPTTRRPGEPASGAPSTLDRAEAAAEWRRPLTGATLGLLLFEAVTGFSVFFLPFSLFNQYAVLVHSALGVLMLAPIVWYVVQHWWRRRKGAFNHYQLLGYLAAAALAVALTSGAVLTWQAWFGTRISWGWDIAHLIAAFALVPLLGAHLVTLLVRRVNSVERRLELRGAWRLCARRTARWALLPLAVCAALALTHSEPEYDSAFPEGYGFDYGIDRPFAPSLARLDMQAVEDELRERIVAVLDAGQRARLLAELRVDPTKHVGIVAVAERLAASFDLSPERRSVVDAALADARARFESEGRVDPRLLAGSERCGTSGCHDEIVAEWVPSAHRYSSMDVVFQEVQRIMATERAPQVTRYCAGCHDPISLLAGAKNASNVTLSTAGAHEGISCIVCHSIVQTDVRGNADFTIRPPRRYLFEESEDAVASALSDFLVRAYPTYHVEAYARPLYKTTEYCGACHKQFIDEEVNLFGWVQGQNQYDSWRKSRWHIEGDPEKTLSCRECHMPLVPSRDPAAGDLDDRGRSPDDGKHRSHRFLAANQFVPLFHELPGAAEHVRMTVDWLRGEFAVPEIAHKWTEGPVVRLKLLAPEEVRAGEPIEVRTVLTNNKTGHDFPTGPLDMIESWVELTVTDESGELVFQSGTLDERDYLINPEIVFKKELIDRDGKLIDRHNLWDAVGAQYGRALFPGFTDTTSFTFACPAMHSPSGTERDAEGERPADEFTVSAADVGDARRLTVKAVLWYSKFKAPFMDTIFGADKRVRAPATAIAETQVVIRVVGHAG